MTVQNPPIAARKPHVNEAHGVRWDDNWHWLRDPGYPDVQDQDVLDYLKAENGYYDAVMSPRSSNPIDPIAQSNFMECIALATFSPSTVPAFSIAAMRMVAES